MRDLGTQPLATERLRLRRFTLDDADMMFANWASDPEVTTFLPWPAYTDKAALGQYLAESVSSYANPTRYNWAMELAGDGTLIGSIGVGKSDDSIEMKSVGYCIGRRWWGRGYTTEALAAVIPYLIEQVGVNRVEAWHHPDNPASGRVMAKCGMRHEGILRARNRCNLGIVDASMWAILADDYKAAHPALDV